MRKIRGMLQMPHPSEIPSWIVNLKVMMVRDALELRKCYQCGEKYYIPIPVYIK